MEVLPFRPEPPPNDPSAAPMALPEELLAESAAFAAAAAAAALTEDDGFEVTVLTEPDAFLFAARFAVTVLFAAAAFVLDE